MDAVADRLALRDLALRAARAGGAAALARFRRADLAVERKADASPVTAADREAEAAIRRAIAAERPDDGLVGEEEGERAGASGRRWIVDPIDGTRNFVRGIPLWATLVACEEDGEGGPRVVAAAAGLPALDEWYDAALGAGARCGDAPIAVSPVADLSGALWCFETPSLLRDHGLGAVFDELCRRTALQRGLGDAYAHLLIASGRAELCVEPSLHVWDIAATSLIVAEAGGRCTALDGRADVRSGEAVYSNGGVHDAALALIRERRR